MSQLMFRKMITISLSLWMSTLVYAAPKTKAKSEKKEIKAETKVKEIVFTAEEKDDGKGSTKKYWLPETQTVGLNEEFKIKLINKATAPHGFFIEGLVDKPVEVIQGKEMTLGPFKANEAKEFKVTCHMHPLHVGAKLIVK